ncbi:MAG TPA: hypothetical protein VJ874_02140 [Candidatus Thermoplasmatota archaeon]|nr:hypothetical protein [Candidatus Thermoplasmatota archaeon]
MRTLALLLALASTAFAGCLDGDSPAPVDPVQQPVVLGPVVNATVASTMAFAESVVTAAVDVSGDLYEPTMEVCEDGSIYITGHTIAVDTTGAPVFGSHDGGASWEQLPFAGPAAAPGPVQGSTPPPSDEIFLSCGQDGWLYGVDITLATYPVNAWSGNGAELAYHNPNAYDEAQVAVQTSESCAPAPAKDRPWGAYANGTLLMVSNPASGPAQVGTLTVPPALPLGIGATVGGGSWNLCAGPGDLPASCRIPGIPDLRDDGRFAVPQLCGTTPVDFVGAEFPETYVLYLVIGDAEDVMSSQVVEVFEHTTAGEITSVYGVAAFDRDGTLFVGISNNTGEEDEDDRMGQLRFAASADAGETFTNRTFTTGLGKPVVHFYMDANDFGPGALAVWAVQGDSDSTYDWYVAHVQLGADGAPVLENVALAIDEGLQPSAHVTGAAVGPDGRAYIAMYRPGSGAVPVPLSPNMPNTPLSVFIQQDGPTLPVTAA